MKTISKNHKKFIAWNVYAWQATSSHFLCEKARLKMKNNVCNCTIKEPSEKSCVFSCLLVTAPFAFCVVTFETCSAPQNDRLNLSFVEDIS
jgi:hypothetical protein